MGYPRADMEPTPESLAAPLPLPPDAEDHHDIRPRRPMLPGHLTPNWSTAFWLGWMLVAAGFAGIWYSSRVTGMATWWLGPETAPRVIFISLLPFVSPIGLTVMALMRRRWLPFWGMAGALATALVAWGDVGGPARYFAIELALAAGGLLVSVASLAGMYRTSR